MTAILTNILSENKKNNENVIIICEVECTP